MGKDKAIAPSSLSLKLLIAQIYDFKIILHWYGVLITRKEGNVLFNDVLNTLYLQLYRVRHMVKDHSKSEKGNPLPPHRLLFLIRSKGNTYLE